MTRDELIGLEVAFTDEWYKEHTGVPTYADAIEYAINNPPKGTSLIKWQTGEPKENGNYLVTYRYCYAENVDSGRKHYTEAVATTKWNGSWSVFKNAKNCKILAWCKLDDVEPFNL